MASKGEVSALQPPVDKNFAPPAFFSLAACDAKP